MVHESPRSGGGQTLIRVLTIWDRDAPPPKEPCIDGPGARTQKGEANGNCGREEMGNAGVTSSHRDPKFQQSRGAGRGRGPKSRKHEQAHERGDGGRPDFLGVRGAIGEAMLNEKYGDSQSQKQEPTARPTIREI